MNAVRTALLLVGVGSGCNTILDNQPGRLRQETSPTDVPPPEEPGLVSPTPEPSSDGGSEASTTPSTTPDAGISLPCGAGLRACKGACVSVDDPRFGCGDPACTPCAIAHGAASCAAGACAVAACEAGWANCNDRANDGCEADLSLAATCGACGTPCPATAPVCAPVGNGHACTTGCAPTAPLLCGGACTAPQTSTAHCGGCDRPCPAVVDATVACTAGVCGFTCNPTFHACGGRCAPALDPTACGPACAVCPAAPNAVPTCTSDVCGFTCAVNTADCNLLPGDGCEAALLVDNSNCGGCGRVCILGTRCDEGECRL